MLLDLTGERGVDLRDQHVDGGQVAGKNLEADLARERGCDALFPEIGDQFLRVQVLEGEGGGGARTLGAVAGRGTQV